MRVTEQVWPEGVTPVVSIICLTYNHQRFIAECLDGFLMQETTFPVEIIVHDDASTDRTADIVREYQSRYPGLFRTINQTENQYSQKRHVINFVLPFARGEFFGYCEGDDFWTYPGKLEEQVRLLEENPRLVMVSHEVQGVLENGEPFPRWRRLADGESVEYSDKDVLRYIFNHPNTWVARNNAALSDTYPLFRTLPMGDDPWNLALLQGGGKGLSLGKVWSAYRQHAGGVWSTRSAFQQGCQVLVNWVSTRKFYAPRYTEEYAVMIPEQRRKLALILSNDITQGKIRQSLSALAYLAGFRSVFFPSFIEMFRIATIAISYAAYRALRATLRRLVRGLTALFGST
jgi:glycosyltransferase involved in cell wall biosynthesis